MGKKEEEIPQWLQDMIDSVQKPPEPKESVIKRIRPKASVSDEKPSEVNPFTETPPFTNDSIFPAQEIKITDVSSTLPTEKRKPCVFFPIYVGINPVYEWNPDKMEAEHAFIADDQDRIDQIGRIITIRISRTDYQKFKFQKLGAGVGQKAFLFSPVGDRFSIPPLRGNETLLANFNSKYERTNPPQK